jgi:hypothetical protein
MSVLAFATGVANTVQKESTQIGDTTSSRQAPYVSENIRFGYTGNGPYEYILSSAEDTLYFDSITGSFWVSDTIYTATEFSADLKLLRVLDGEVDLLYLITNADETLDLYCYNGTDYDLIYTTTSSDGDVSANLFRVDINFRYGTDGGLDLYLDRQLINSSDFDTTGIGLSPDRLRVGTSTTTTLWNDTYHSSIMVADEDTTLLTMVQFTLDGDGSFTDFTHDYSYLSAFGETGDNYAVESSDAGDVATYTFASRSSEISGGVVVGLGLYCRAKTQESVSADQFRFVTYDGTDTAYSDYIAMDEYITPYQKILTTNPAGDAWTLDDIATHEFGFEVSENG